MLFQVKCLIDCVLRATVSKISQWEKCNGGVLGSKTFIELFLLTEKIVASRQPAVGRAVVASNIGRRRMFMKWLSYFKKMEMEL